MARLTDSEWKVMEALWQGGPQTLGEVLAQFPQILEDPAPSIWISKYGASSIEYVVRMWTAAGDYWDVYYGVMEGVRPAFQRHGIQMTYDHLNVHLLEK